MKAKRILSLIVAALMLMTIVAVPSFADTSYVMTLDADDVAKFGTTYTLVIDVTTPGTMQAVGCWIKYDDALFTPDLASITGVAALNASQAAIVDKDGSKAVLLTSTMDGVQYPTAGTAWATITFNVAEGTTGTTANFEIIGGEGDTTWGDGNYNNVDVADITFPAVKTVNVVTAHTAPTFDVAIDNAAPVSGDTLEATVSNFVDNWDLTPAYAYQWLADGVAIAGATNATYNVVAADYNKAISVKVTATVVSDDAATDTAEVTSAATAAVKVPDVAPELTVVDERDDTVAVGTTIAANASATIDALVGGTNKIAYSWKVDGVEVGTDATYTVATADYVDGDEKLTCDIVASNDRTTKTATATITFTNAIVAGNMPPVVSEMALSNVADSKAIVGAKVVASYKFTDVADAANTPEDLDGGVKVAWYIGKEKIADGTELVMDKAWIGKTIDVVFAPWSNDKTPNEILGYTEEQLLNGAVETVSFVVEPDLNTAPVVSNVVILGGTINVGSDFTVSYDYKDINGFADNSVIELYNAADDSKLVVDTDYTISGNKITVINESLVDAKVYVKVTPQNPAGYSYVAALVAADSIDTVVNKKATAASGGAGMTGPSLGGGASKPTQAPTTAPTEEPTTAPTEEPTTEPTDAPVEAPVPAAKDCISLVIDNTAINAYGENYTSDVAPFIVNDRTVLPVRAICELLGAKVEWIESTRAVILHFEGRKVELKIDDNKAIIDGVEVELNIAPFISSDRTFLGLRDMAEAINMNVEWHDSVRTVSITAK